MTREELRQMEAAFALPHKLSGNALAARVAADMVTWTMLQKEIEQRSQLEEIDLDWECRRDSARERDEYETSEAQNPHSGNNPW